MEVVDLGVCEAVHQPGSGVGSAVVLPGASFSVDAPPLWYARLVLAASGRSVLSLLGGHDGRHDARRWVTTRLEAGLRFLGDPAGCVIVAKSISTLATPLAAERGLPGIWLTPLLRPDRWGGASDVVDGLRAARAPALAIGGTADPAWDGEVVRRMPSVEVLELAGADHALHVAGDPRRTLDALGDIVAAMERFVRELPG